MSQDLIFGIWLGFCCGLTFHYYLEGRRLEKENKINKEN